ncbi:MAG: DJ-1/PfpI family protein [Verrucomicrobia bacterium]|nr:DJ-1/PfpI family protein [Verrucomicrobiota bacterium]
MPRKILIVTDDAGESFEILYAQHRFAEAGFTPVIAATQKKRLNAVIHDFYPGWNTYIEKPGYLIASDVTFAQVKPADYAAILLIGGRAPEFLRHNAKLIQIVQAFHREKKPLLSICHGIQILLAAGIGRGLKLTCYENVRFEVEACGGTWINRQCVRDGHIITAQTWESHPDFYREAMALLGKP